MAGAETPNRKTLPWNVLQMIRKISQLAWQYSKTALKRNMPFGFERKWMDTEATTWPDEKATTWGKSIVEQILGSEEYIKSKRVLLWESQIWIHVWMLTIGVKWFETKKNDFPWWISSSGISLPVILMDLRWIKSPKINTVTVVG